MNDRDNGSGGAPVRVRAFIVTDYAAIEVTEFIDNLDFTNPRLLIIRERS